MTVETQIFEVTASGDGANKVFSFSPQVIFKTSELVVTLVTNAGVETLLVEGATSTTYSVQVADFPGTGTVTYPASGGTAIASTVDIHMKRVLVLEQTVDLENQGGYFPETIEEALDKLLMISQQQQEEIDRCLKFSTGIGTSFDTSIDDSAAGTALQVVQINSNADGITLGNSTTATGTFSLTTTAPMQDTGGTTPVISIDAGTSTVAGALELLTDAETLTGSDTARAMTAANLTAKLATPGAIGGTTASAGNFTTIGTTGIITLTDIAAGALVGPSLTLHRNSSSPAASDVIGAVFFQGEDSASNITNYGRVVAAILDPVNGQEDGEVQIQAMINTTLTSVLNVGDGVQVGAPGGGYRGAGFLSATGLVAINTSTSVPALLLETNEASGTQGPILRLQRDSDSPANADTLASIQFNGENDAGQDVTYSNILGGIRTVTDSSEDGYIFFQTAVSGTEATATMSLSNGVIVGAPTGGYKGTGTLNATAVYDDNSILTPYVLEAAISGTIDTKQLDKDIPNKDSKGQSKNRKHEPARKFKKRMDRDLDPFFYAADWKSKGHLSALPSRDEWVDTGNFSTGDLIQRLMETVEVQAVHIDKLEQRLTNGGL